MKFEQLGINPELLKGVDARGYKYPTPIQQKAIPPILKRNDLLGGAQTGTGKTAAFALPILDLLSRKKAKSNAPRALVLAPTRELTEQLGESFIQYGQYLDLSITKIYGGVKMNPQISKLAKGTDIVVATPGRLKDHLEQKKIDLSGIEIFVLDEADRMLDMGFIEDIMTIFSSIPKRSQNLLFSATYGNDIESLAKEILKNPVSVEVAKRNTAAAKVEQMIHFVDKGDRLDLLVHLINEGQWYQVLVFVKTKQAANRLASDLLKAGIRSAAIHGDKSQGARNRALREFKNGNLQALVATDVAARGIDLDDLSHVVNFELPQIPEDYIHRIGRTGRAGKPGTAISLISYSELGQLKKIEKILKGSIPVRIASGFEPKHNFNRDSEPSRKSPKRKNPKYSYTKPEKPKSENSRYAKDKSGKPDHDNSRSNDSRRGKPRSDKPGYDSSRSNDSRRGNSRSDKPGYDSSSSGKSRRPAGKTGKPGYDRSGSGDRRQTNNRSGKPGNTRSRSGSRGGGRRRGRS